MSGKRERAEAAEWFAKMRGPEASAVAPQLAAWRAARRENDEAYEQIVRRWDQSAFLTNSSLGRGRDLGRAAIWSQASIARFASAAAILLVLVGLWAVSPNQRWVPSHAVANASTIRTGRELRTVALPDGSHVTLDAGSTIRLFYADGARRIRLVGGRARFDVATASGSPFIVDVDRGTVAAEAGSFDVGLARGRVQVTLWHGLVNVSGALQEGDQVEARSRRLRSGQRLTFLPLQALPEPTAAAAGDVGWTAGMLAFDKQSLADAAATINRYNRVQIKVLPPIAGLRISGGFRATDPKEFVRAVSSMFDLSVVKDADGTLLLAPEIKA